MLFTCSLYICFCFGFNCSTSSCCCWWCCYYYCRCFLFLRIPCLFLVIFFAGLLFALSFFSQAYVQWTLFIHFFGWRLLNAHFYLLFISLRLVWGLWMCARKRKSCAVRLDSSPWLFHKTIRIQVVRPTEDLFSYSEIDVFWATMHVVLHRIILQRLKIQLEHVLRREKFCDDWVSYEIKCTIIGRNSRSGKKW